MKKIKYEKGDLTEWMCLAEHPKNKIPCSRPWGHEGDHTKFDAKGMEVVRWRRNEYLQVDV